MLFVSGDTHGVEDVIVGPWGLITGGVKRFSTKNFPQQKGLGREDFLALAGDFGLPFSDPPTAEERHYLRWMEERPFSTVFVPGNHENYTYLSRLPWVPFHGGWARELSPHVHMLESGWVYELGGYRVFAFGGASSHDYQELLEAHDPMLKEKEKRLRRNHVHYRVRGLTWWPEETPDQEAYQRARRELDGAGWSVDIVLTHAAPTSIQRRMAPGYPSDALTDFLEEVYQKAAFQKWYCGHYHVPQTIGENFEILYWNIEQV